jgi:hypothetical protein
MPWVGCRIAESGHEQCAEKFVVLGNRFPPLGSQGLDLVQDRRNPPLLRQWWKCDSRGFQMRETKVLLS